MGTRDFGEVPRRVEYELSLMGESDREDLVALGSWISTNTPTVLAARKKYKRR